MRDLNMSSIRSIDRGIDVLEAFTFENPTLSLDEISKITKIPNSTVYRIICTFEKRGLIQFDKKNSTYTFGFKLIEYGALANHLLDIVKIADEDLMHLQHLTKQTVVMAIKLNNEILYVSNKEQNEGLKYSTRVGQTRPFNFGVLGPVLLAYSSDAEIERYIDNSATTFLDQSIINKEEFRNKLDKIREYKLNIDKNETTMGATGIGTPIFGINDTVIAAIGILGPTVQIQDQLDLFSSLIKSTAQEISMKITPVD